MIKIRLSFAFAALLAGGLITFVTVAPQPGVGGLLADARTEIVMA